MLFTLMARAGLKPSEVFVTHLLKCPSKTMPLRSIRACKGWLWEEIKAVGPEWVIATGQEACSLLAGPDVPLGTVARVPWASKGLITLWKPRFILARGMKFHDKVVKLLGQINEPYN